MLFGSVFYRRLWDKQLVLSDKMQHYGATSIVTRKFCKQYCGDEKKKEKNMK